MNTLDPNLEFYDPNGVLVATDLDSASDGRNAVITYTTLLDGEYSVQVAASGDEGGDYTLTVLGATRAALHGQPTVVAVSPSAGEALGSPPTELEITLSEAISPNISVRLLAGETTVGWSQDLNTSDGSPEWRSFVGVYAGAWGIRPLDEMDGVIEDSTALSASIESIRRNVILQSGDILTILASCPYRDGLAEALGIDPSSLDLNGHGLGFTAASGDVVQLGSLDSPIFNGLQIVPPRTCCDDDPENDPPPVPIPDNPPPSDLYDSPVVRPRDPNDILGPPGFGDEHWVTATETLNYRIRFENTASSTAPAQVVEITMQLDEDADFRSFRFDDIGFGDNVIELPDNQAFLFERVDMVEDLGFFVDVIDTLDVVTGEVAWRVSTIDPNTGEAPEDASIGFLPPNTEEPLDTPPIFNTLDAGVPASSMTVLPDVAPSREFPITWTGVDDTEGSALAGFDVYVSDNGSDFDLRLENTTVNAGTYPGEDGHRYAFYTVSRDNAGNVEDAPLEPDAETITSGFSAITGMKFEDIDEDGVKDDGEPGMGGFTIFLDLDADGELDDNEVRTITGTDGTYELAGITAGTHRVAEAPKPGWRQSFPAESFYVIELLDGETASSTDFGNFGVPVPTAGFSANPLQGNEPLLVVFTNNSTSDATSFAWDFDLDTDSDEDGDPANDVDTTATSTVAVYMEGRYSVSLQGVSGTTTLSAIAPTVTLESGTGVDATSTTMLLGTDGSFQFMHAPDGAYTISVDAPGFLQAMRVNLIVTGGAVVMPTVDLRAGRVNTDDIVNILDVSATAASFLQIVVARMDAYGRVVDVNGDGIVNINDLTAVTSNFTLVNPQIW